MSAPASGWRALGFLACLIASPALAADESCVQQVTTELRGAPSDD